MMKLTLYDKVRILMLIPKWKSFVLDGLINWMVSVSVVSIVIGIPAQWTLSQYTFYWIGSPIMAFTVGATFGRILNAWRRIWRYS